MKCHALDLSRSWRCVAGGAIACGRNCARRCPASPLPGITPARVRGVPARPRRLSRGRDRGRRARARPSTARAAPSATTCRRSAAPARSPRCAPGARDASGRFETLDATGETLFQLFSMPTHGCQAIVPAEANVFARRVPIPLFGAGLVEAIPDDTILALEDPFDRDRDGVSGRAARIVDVATGERAHRPVRLEGAARDAAHVRRRRLPQRDGHHQRRLLRRSWPSASPPSGCAPAIRLPIPKTSRDPRTRRRGIDNFASFMRFLGPVAREGSSELTRAGEQVFAAIGCATCHRPGADDRAEQQPAVRSQAGGALLGSAAARRRHRRRHRAGRRPRRTRSARRRCGGCGSGGRCCTTAPRRRSKTPSGGTRGEAELARRGFEQLSDADRAALLAFLRSI